MPFRIGPFKGILPFKTYSRIPEGARQTIVTFHGARFLALADCQGHPIVGAIQGSPLPTGNFWFTAEGTLVPHTVDTFLSKIDDCRRLKTLYQQRREAVAAYRRNETHTHTQHSDGELSVNDLIIHFGRCGVATLVLMDHNTVDGVEESVKLAGDKKTFNVDITFGGVELTTFFPDREWHSHEVHIKVFFDPARIKEMEGLLNGLRIREKLTDIYCMQIEEFKAITNREELDQFIASFGLDPTVVIEQIRSAAQRRLKLETFPSEETTLAILLSAFEGMRKLTPEKTRAAGAASVNKDMGKVMREDFGILPREDELAYRVFRQFTKRAIAYDLYLARVQYPSIEEILGRARAAGAWISFAHPKQTEAKGFQPEDIRALIRHLAERGLLNSVEVRYPTHGESTRQAYGQLARELDLAIDGGSDFHKIKETEPGAEHVPFEFFERVRSFLAAPHLEMGRRCDESDDWESVMTAITEYEKAMVLAPYREDIYELYIDACQKAIEITGGVEQLTATLLDPKQAVGERLKAARGLRNFERPAVTLAFNAILRRRENPDLQGEAIDILAKRCDPQTILALGDFVKDLFNQKNYPREVAAAEKALKATIAKIDDDQQIDSLLMLLRDRTFFSSREELAMLSKWKPPLQSCPQVVRRRLYLESSSASFLGKPSWISEDPCAAALELSGAEYVPVVTARTLYELTRLHRSVSSRRKIAQGFHDYRWHGPRVNHYEERPNFRRVKECIRRLERGSIYLAAHGQWIYEHTIIQLLEALRPKPELQNRLIWLLWAREDGYEYVLEKIDEELTKRDSAVALSLWGVRPYLFRLKPELRVSRSSAYDETALRDDERSKKRVEMLPRREVILVLREMLTDTANERDRFLALVCLKNIGDRAVLPEVENLLNDPYEEVKWLAEEVVDELRKKDV